MLNFDHFPVHLQIPQNSLLARSIPPPTLQHPRILNPIPPNNIENFQQKFFETNTILIDNLTTILSHANLNETQWHLACTSLNDIINNISLTIQQTCSAPPILPLTHTIAQQGGYLPRKIHNLWITDLSTYHLIRKTIYITHHDPNWQTDPLILNLHNHNAVNIPLPPLHP
jgi:hypothetical protein